MVWVNVKPRCAKILAPDETKRYRDIPVPQAPKQEGMEKKKKQESRSTQTETIGERGAAPKGDGERQGSNTKPIVATLMKGSATAQTAEATQAQEGDTGESTKCVVVQKQNPLMYDPPTTSKAPPPTGGWALNLKVYSLKT